MITYGKWVRYHTREWRYSGPEGSRAKILGWAITMATFIPQGGTVYASAQTLAGAMGTDESTARRWRSKLVKLGLFRKTGKRYKLSRGGWVDELEFGLAPHVEDEDHPRQANLPGVRRADLPPNTSERDSRERSSNVRTYVESEPGQEPGEHARSMPDESGRALTTSATSLPLPSDSAMAPSAVSTSAVRPPSEDRARPAPLAPSSPAPLAPSSPAPLSSVNSTTDANSTADDLEPPLCIKCGDYDLVGHPCKCMVCKSSRCRGVENHALCPKFLKAAGQSYNADGGGA
jgi:Helix-turn-helix domain